MVLGKRYLDDGKPLLALCDIQLETLQSVKGKIASKRYRMVSRPCPVCASDSDSDFEMLAEKDRYGITAPTVICRKCGMVQSRPYMDTESCNEFYRLEQKKLYVGNSSVSDEYFQRQQVRGNAIFKYVAAELGANLSKNSQVLEVGCSAGGILKPFHDFGCPVCGVDLAEDYVRYGRERMGMPLEYGTIDAILASGRKFDLVIYSHVLEHIVNVEEELSKIAQALAPGGHLFIEVPGVMNIANAYGGDFLLYLQNAHVWHFSLLSLKGLLARNGFNAISGTEEVKLIAKKAPPSETMNENGYSETIRFLQRQELFRPFGKAKRIAMLPFRALRKAWRMARCK